MTEAQEAELAAPEPDSAHGTGDRGTLTIRDKVAQRLAIRAALDTPGVLPFSAGLTLIAGRSLPPAQLTITTNRVTVHLRITVAWPAPSVEVARAVQRNVAQTLSTMAGLHVERVDITVGQFSTATHAKKTQ